MSSERHLAVAHYLCGFVQFARGDLSCLRHYQEAVRASDGEPPAFCRWLRYSWALAFREFGDAEQACAVWRRSGIRIPWEDPLFSLACGETAPVLALDGSPDERPFRAAMRGVQQHLGGDSASAVETLGQAVDEFARCELEHFRRGAALALAAALLGAGEYGRPYGSSAPRRLP